MKIEKGILKSVEASDLENGVFHNSEVVEVANGCFYNMPELKKVVLPKVKKIGSDCLNYNASLTSVSLPVCTTLGSDCLSSNDKLTSVSLGKINFITKNVDGYCFVIESEKATKGIKIYSGFNLNGMEKGSPKIDYCYVAEKDKFTAHGDTIKKAIEDVQFKIISDKLKKEPIKKDTVITINYYRLITGACELGVKDWMKQNNIKKEKIKASDLLPLLEKTNAYGLQKFKSLITF